MSLENTLERIAIALESLALGAAKYQFAPVAVDNGAVAPDQVQAPASVAKPRTAKPKPTPAETPAPAVTPEPQDANPAPAAEIPAATAAPKVVEPPAGFTLDDVRKVCRELANLSDREGIMEVFGVLGGIKTLDALKPAQYAQAIQLFSAKVAQAKTAQATLGDDDIPF